MNTQITAGRISRPVRRNEKAVQVDRPRRQIIQFNGRPLLLPTVCNLIQPKGRIHSPFTKATTPHGRLPGYPPAPDCFSKSGRYAALSVPTVQGNSSVEERRNQLQPDRIEKRAVVEHMDVLFHEQVIPVYRRVFSRHPPDVPKPESCKR